MFGVGGASYSPNLTQRVGPSIENLSSFLGHTHNIVNMSKKSIIHTNGDDKCCPKQ
jgi:hypothetical protein